MYSLDLRWRAVTLHYAYGVPCEQVARIFGVSGRTVRRWYDMFKRTGHVVETHASTRAQRSPELLEFVASYVRNHPCFYVEELQTALFPRFGALSQSSVLRVLKLDLKLSRKVFQKCAREALPAEVESFVSKLRCWYSDPVQLLFIDETSKGGRDSMRGYAWSARGTRAVVSVPFSRGKPVSILAACDVTGFVAWRTTRGTFTRREFHRAFVHAVLPLLNPWPLPRSIVVLDNAKIHMYPEFAAAVHSCGALLIYLPPYCPQFNPIEVMFGQLKRRLARHANLAFAHFPELVLDATMRACMESDSVGSNFFSYCGYTAEGLDAATFVLGSEN